MLVIGKNKKYLVLLEWANFAFGGRQAWFLCPPQGCERWVAILYSGSVLPVGTAINLPMPASVKMQGIEQYNELIASESNYAGVLALPTQY